MWCVLPERNGGGVTDSEPHDWRLISSAPFGRDLQLAVFEGDGIHSLVFPCRRTLTGWISSETRDRIEISPTHWRHWTDDPGIRRRGANRD